MIVTSEVVKREEEAAIIIDQYARERTQRTFNFREKFSFSNFSFQNFG